MEIYVDKPQHLEYLKENIQREILRILLETLTTVMEYVVKRAEGGHLTNTLL